ncbi:uncharacterized protein LOC108675833 [Hyalella azteca]|uniref:Uncharacterized protein LOC108675833 n=1 Tax=Hyalella azteca TaxID=294128 RepID=A0A8B7P2V4_HYAAZ|nr:uncharacterized protein LOC108675833 [Hyalella azteca]
MRSRKCTLKMAFLCWVVTVLCAALLLVATDGARSSVTPTEMSNNRYEHPQHELEDIKTLSHNEGHADQVKVRRRTSLLELHEAHHAASRPTTFVTNTMDTKIGNYPRNTSELGYQKVITETSRPNNVITGEQRNTIQYDSDNNFSFQKRHPEAFFNPEDFETTKYRMPLPRTEPRRARQVTNQNLNLPIIMPLKRPKNVSRSASPNYPWGSHAFGPLHTYTRSPLGTKWNAYFYDQTIAVILEDQDRALLNCTLLEVIPQHEQRAALRSLGQVMALVPLTFRQMVQLSYYCKSTREILAPKSTTQRRIAKNNPTPDVLWDHASSLFSGIMPGTVWCGLGDRARVYEDLGERRELDTCCRAHDHCPVKVRASASRYGIRNTAFSTVSHCLCDDAFRMCLEKAALDDEMAATIGELFFNIIRPQCLVRPRPRPPNPRAGSLTAPGGVTPHEADHEVYRPRLDCLAIDDQNGCRWWTTNPKSLSLNLKIITPNFRYIGPGERKS